MERLKGLPDGVNPIWFTRSCEPGISVGTLASCPAVTRPDPVESALSIKQQSREACGRNNPSDIDAKAE